MNKKGLRLIVLLGLIFLVTLFYDDLSHALYRVDKTFQRYKAAGRISKVIEVYENEKGSYIDCRFASSDREYARAIIAVCDFYYELLCRDFGVAIETAPLIIYPTRDDMAKALGVPKENLPMGAYYGGMINVLSPRIWAGDDSGNMDEFIKNGPLVHELTHYVMGLKRADNDYDEWLAEGVALYYENKYTGFEWRPQLSLIAKELPSEAMMDFRGVDQALAYRKAYELIRDYVDKNGERALQERLSK